MYSIAVRDIDRHPAVPWAVIALAAVLRLPGLARSELWFDEAYAALLSTEPFSAIVSELSRDSSPPLYYFVLRLWRLCSGGSAVALRTLSVAAAVGAVYVAIKLAAGIWNPRAGWLTGLLLALSPLHVYYSQEVRPYSLFVLFALLALLGLTRLSRSGSPWRDGGLYCAGVLLAIYTHNYGLFLLGPLIVEVLRGRVVPRVAVACTAAVAAGYAPWVSLLAHQMSAGSAAWVARVWHQTPPAWALPKSLAVFSIGGRAPSYIPLASGALPLWVHLIAYAVFAVLVARAVQVELDEADGSARQLASWAAVLIVVPYCVSFAFPIYVVGRYDVIALPVFLALAARGWQELRRPASWLAAALVVALAVVSLSSYYARPALRGAARQAALISRHDQGHDAVLSLGFTRNPLEYYVQESGRPMAFFSFPSSLGAHRGWLDERQLQDPAAVLTDADLVVESIATRQGPADRLWVAHSRLLGDAATSMLTRLNESFRPTPCPEHAEDLGISCWSNRSTLAAAH